MRKSILCFLLLLSYTCFAEDLFYITTLDTEAARARTGEKIVLKKGAVLKMLDGFYNDFHFNKGIFYNQIDLGGYFEYDSNEYNISATNLLPLETQDIFENVFITKSNDTNDRLWIMDYYLNVIISDNNSAVFNYESFWAEQYNVDDMTIPSVSLNWEDVYEDFFPYFGPVYFTNASIHITYTHFGIKTIVRNGEEFVVEAKNNGYMFETFTSTTPLNWEKINDKEMIRIIFVLDGDYMDVYLEDKDEKLCTLVNIETSFIDEYMKFIHNGKVNFGNLGKWPKRADGSMDYPPPQLTQAVPDEPETVTMDTPPAEYEDAVTLEQETVAQQPETALPLIIMLTAAGVLVAAGVVVFLLKRKK